MRPICTFVYRDILSGGCENLIKKLSSVLLKEYQIHVKCIYETIKHEEKKQLFELGVELNQTRWDKIEGYCNGLEGNNIHWFVTFEWNDFLKLFLCRNDNKWTVIYGVHPKSFVGFKETNDLRISNKREFYRVMKSLIEYHHVLVMDEIIKRQTQHDIGTLEEMKILSLPIDITRSWNQIESQIEKRYNAKIILTAARAEFPFKGYLIGLIEWFSCLNREDIKLVIVTYGSEIDTIKNILSNISLERRNRIDLIEGLRYEELIEVMNKAYLYIGMGTSILDAASIGVPSIPIEPDTYELRSNLRFDQTPTNICATDIYKYTDFSDCVDNVLDLTLSEYQIISNKSYQVVCEKYNKQTITEGLIDYFKLSMKDLESISLDIRVWEGLIEKQRILTEKKLDNFIKKLCNRKLAIYGAGIGGRDIFYLLNAMDTRLFCFFDEKYAAKTQLYDVPVKSPDDILDSSEMAVIVSLKRYDERIINFLESKNYIYDEDYILLFCEKGVRSYV